MPSFRALRVVRDRLGQHDGRIVGRFGDQGQDRVPGLDGSAFLQLQLGGGLCGGMGRNAERLVGLEPFLSQGLERHIEGHHLCQGGGVELIVLLIGVQDSAGIRVQDQRRFLGLGRPAGGQHAGKQETGCQALGKGGLAAFARGKS
jgi:hypothetical protein